MNRPPNLPSYTRKPRPSKLDPFAEEIQGWFEEEKIPFPEAVQRLKTRGCSTSLDNLGRWWRKRRSNALEEQLLDQIEFAGDQCLKLDRAFRKSPAPVIDILLKVHRVLILKLNNSDTLAKMEQPCSAVTGSVKDAVRMGCAAIGYTIYQIGRAHV